jgi:drug/metabolite transporter (DMT)-like permease
VPDLAVLRPPRSRVLTAYAAVYVVWGSTYLAIRYAIETLPPFLMAGIRFLIAGALLFLWARLRGAPRPSLANWKGTLLIGALLLLGGNGAVVWAEQRVPSGIAALLVATVPLWMVLIEWLRPGGRRPTARVALGVVAGMFGLLVLVGPGSLRGDGNVNALGAAALVFGSLSWAVGSLWSKRVTLPESPSLATGMEMLAGGALLLLAGIGTGELAALDLGGASLASMGALAYLILFGSLVGFSAYVWLLKVEPPARVATYAYVNPVVAVLLGWLVAGERITGATLVAAAIIIGAVVLIVSGRKPDAAQHDEAEPEPAEGEGRQRRRAVA